jgi:hypothetical protein
VAAAPDHRGGFEDVDPLGDWDEAIRQAELHAQLDEVYFETQRPEPFDGAPVGSLRPHRRARIGVLTHPRAATRPGTKNLSPCRR